MSPSERLARYIRRNTNSQKTTKTIKSDRSVAPMLIAAVAVLAAVVFQYQWSPDAPVGCRRLNPVRQGGQQP